MKPDSELQEALDRLRDRTLESKGQPSTSGAKAAYIIARKSIESLFERRVAELESLLDRTRNLANANLAEMDAKVSLLEAARNDLLLVVEELNDLRKTAEANALTRWQVEEILGGPPESGRPGYLQHHPDCVPPSDCQCNLFGIQNKLRSIALRLLSESEEKP